MSTSKLQRFDSNGKPVDPRIIVAGPHGYVSSRERSYQDLIEQKRHVGADDGFDPLWMPDFLYPFQSEIVAWAIQKGRAAIFADCGLGKTPMQLVWSRNVSEKTNKPVLILTPLAVSYQTLEEAKKFGIDAHRSSDGSHDHAHITITNYERLDHFRSSDFGGVVCDESSILKNFNGATRQAITDFMRKVPYRLLCTATASPNDYIELGTSSESLGWLGHMDMLGRFFRNDEKSLHPMWYGSKWRFKHHAERPFWRWVCSWARALRRPSDLGYDDDGFDLPPLSVQETVIACTRPLDGALFPMPAVTLHEQRQERRMTIRERCETAAQLADHKDPAVLWCHLNDEANLLEQLVPDGMQVFGTMSMEEKEETLKAFSDGELRVLITKPKIAAFGMNWQHCAHMTMFPSHSFEQYYQGVRRCWRFGQTRSVVVDIITTEGELGVLKNLQRKADAANQMFDSLTEEMRHELSITREDRHTKPIEVPSWLL